MRLISLQPNVNWLSGSISKASLKMENNWVEPLFVCMHHLHTYAHTHRKPTRIYSHWVGGVYCVIVWSWARLSLIPEWMVCCVPAIPLCLSKVFLGIRPHLLPGAAGRDQSWLSLFGLGRWCLEQRGSTQVNLQRGTGEHDTAAQTLHGDTGRTHLVGVKPALIQQSANWLGADW